MKENVSVWVKVMVKVTNRHKKIGCKMMGLDIVTTYDIK
jgi:hypothetical protein